MKKGNIHEETMTTKTLTQLVDETITLGTAGDNAMPREDYQLTDADLQWIAHEIGISGYILADAIRGRAETIREVAWNGKPMGTTGVKIWEIRGGPIGYVRVATTNADPVWEEQDSDGFAALYAQATSGRTE